MRIGRGEAVGELREGEAVLARGSERAEERRGGSSAAASSLPEYGVERRRRSIAWERGESKRRRGIGRWGL